MCASKLELHGLAGIGDTLGGSEKRALEKCLQV